PSVTASRPRVRPADSEAPLPASPRDRYSSKGGLGITTRTPLPALPPRSALPRMPRRSRAREVALQLLFQRDVNPGVQRLAVEQFVRERLGNPDLEPFCLGLYDGVVKHLEAIDAKLGAAAENWRLPRMAAVDRNVLRLGSYELLFAAESTPGPVALN